MLNGIWAAFILVAALGAFGQAVFGGDIAVFGRMVDALFAMAKLSVELMLVLFGTLALWMGLLRMAERAGLVDTIARWLAPLFSRLMPGVPAGHPAIGLVTMNFAANVLGLDNAATPIGIRAMHALQSLNPEPARATDAQILFLVLNASSLTLLPVTIFAYRLQQGSAQPADVFVPILLATSASTLAGLLCVALMQRLKLLSPQPLLALAAIGLVLGALVASLAGLSAEALSRTSTALGNGALIAVIVAFVLCGLWRRVPVYESFIDGAREAFDIARNLLPYLVAMLCAIGLLRASGVLELLLGALRAMFGVFDWDLRIVDALPTALMKPFSGSAARGMMIETMKVHGADSFAGRLASVMQGSTETTFYVLAVYFGAVGVRITRHAVPCALIAEAAGVLASILVCLWFFGGA